MKCPGLFLENLQKNRRRSHSPLFTHRNKLLNRFDASYFPPLPDAATIPPFFHEIISRPLPDPGFLIKMTGISRGISEIYRPPWHYQYRFFVQTGIAKDHCVIRMRLQAALKNFQPRAIDRSLILCFASLRETDPLM